ncbi:hypothetical protein PG991_011904 [Apiospora marii]|uniref:Uncharacterized protein n=1 Tax=Apiospora marii TaxID=335849 RepID=A0ABR1RFH9_9PEZI
MRVTPSKPPTSIAAQTGSTSTNAMSQSKIDELLKAGSRESPAERRARVERVVAEATAALTPVEPHGGGAHTHNGTN